MSSGSGEERRFFRNLLWLGALSTLLVATVLVWLRGGELFAPSRDTAAVKAFRLASPAVVNISAEPLPDRNDLGFWSRRKMLNPEELLRRFFEQPGIDDKINLGSGIIVDPRGYILTNEHVVNNTAWIQVTLADGRTASGEVWGTEPSLDLAVIKIDLEDPLPYMEMGRSNDIMIGEDIVVIGNPLGLGHTCTKGIVSALHRPVRVGARVYLDLVQIDAAVNPGNSGGPLLNIRGELTGITTTLDPESEGIGFAIPIDRAREVVDDLIEYRYVPTGWLGISVEDLGEGTAEAFGLEDSEGVFISRIEKNGPAAGVLKVGDVLEEWNGSKLRGIEDFVKRARKLRSGQKVTFTRIREGKRKRDVRLSTTAFPEQRAEEWAWWHIGIRVYEDRMWTRDRNGRIIEKSAVFVEGIAGDSPAQASGLAPADLIIRLNLDNIENLEDFRKAIVLLRKRENVFIVFQKATYPWRAQVGIPFLINGESW